VENSRVAWDLVVCLWYIESLGRASPVDSGDMMNAQIDR
jgi:hypothetical protein